MRDHHRDEPHIGVLIKMGLALKVTSSASVKSLLGIDVAVGGEVLGLSLALAATTVPSSR